MKAAELRFQRGTETVQIRERLKILTVTGQGKQNTVLYVRVWAWLPAHVNKSRWPIDSRNTASLERRKAVQLEEDPAGESFQYDQKWSILR